MFLRVGAGFISADARIASSIKFWCDLKVIGHGPTNFRSFSQMLETTKRYGVFQTFYI